MPYLRDVSNLVATGVCLLFITLVVSLHMHRECQRLEKARSRQPSRSGIRAGGASPSPTGTPGGGGVTPTFDRADFPNTQRRGRKSLSAVTSVLLRFPDELERKRRTAELITWISVLSSIAMVTGTLWLRLSYFRLLPWVPHCQTASEAMVALYITVRVSIYIVFVNRIDMSFHGTVYAYGDRTIGLCYAVVFLVGLTLAIWAPFAVQSEGKRGSNAPNGKSVGSDSDRGMKICVPKIDLLISIFIVLFDIIFIAVMVRMFVVPLRKLFAHTEEEQEMSHPRHASASSLSAVSSSDIRVESDLESAECIRLSRSQVMDLEMRLLPVKYSVISVVSVISTCLALIIVAVSGNGLFMTVDNVINVVSLLLMQQEWTIEYWRVCGPLLRSLHSLRMVGERTHNQLWQMTAFYWQSAEQRRVMHQNHSSTSRLPQTPPPSVRTEVDFM